MRGPALIVSLSVGLLACTTRGTHFDPDSVPLIHIGETSIQEVRALFGEPTSARSWGSGGIRWSYRNEETRTTDTGMLSRIASWISWLAGRRWIWSPVNVRRTTTIAYRLDVIFTADGVVDDYVYERTEVPSTSVY
jgi:hypothetical protein